MVKSEMEAVYQDHMGNDLTIVNAARQSFAKQKETFGGTDVGLINFLATGMRTKEWDEFLNEVISLSGEARFAQAEGAPEAREALKQRLLKYKRQAVHFAPFAHPHAILRLRMPVFLARQYVKHQVGGTWSEESRRYIEDIVDYYMEPVLHIRPDDVKQGSGSEIENSEELLLEMEHITNASNELYVKLLSLKVAPEEARQILTLNAMTGITWTGSLLFWARVVTQRVDPHAQGAAQVLARKIDAILRPLYPVSWAALVGEI